MRVGIGYDIHRFGADRALKLGGIEIPEGEGLEGWSDADCLLHAICDALLGAAGLPDIGHFFPDTDPVYKNIDSQVLLARVCGELSRRGFAIGNIDATVIAEQPKIFPQLAAMKAALARSTHLPVTNIGLKATTNEGVGDLGRGLAIAAHAVALIAKV